MRRNRTRRAAGPSPLPLLLLIVGGLILLPSGSQAARPPHASGRPAPPTGIAFTIAAVAVPARLPAGLVALTLHNDGRDMAHAYVMRLRPGVTRAQIRVVSRDREGLARAAHLVTFAGGIDGLPVGGRETVIVRLVPGPYALRVNTLNPADPTRLAFVTATAAGSATVAQPAAATLDLSDQGITLAGRPAAGVRTLAVVNVGAAPHNALLYKLAPGKTVGDFLAAFAAPGAQPRWVTNVGGMGLLSPHATAWMTLPLVPGHYVALGFLGRGRPIVGSFTVH
jgi:hypothetical protein